MRICAVTSFPPAVAGIADYGALLVDEFARDPRVEHVTVLADRVQGAPDHDGAGRVEVRRVWERDRPDAAAALLRAIDSDRPDVVWFNLGLTMFGGRALGTAASVLVPLLVRLRGYRSVVTLHEVPALADLRTLGLDGAPRRLLGSAALRLVLRASLVVVTLDRYRGYLAATHRADNVRHIPHGAWAEPRRVDEPDDETVLVFGTFGPHKDPGLVAQAVAELQRRRPGVRLLVAGADHPRYPGFMAVCRERHGLNGSWLGYVDRDDVPALFARARVVVVPARASSGASGVIHRAIGHGRAVLASDLPDFRALAAEERLALEWFAPGDVRSLADALGGLLDDRARRTAQVAHNIEAMSQRAPAHTASEYLAAFVG